MFLKNYKEKYKEDGEIIRWLFKDMFERSVHKRQTLLYNTMIFPYFRIKINFLQLIVLIKLKSSGYVEIY